MAVGDAAARRLHRALEDAGDGCDVERGGDKNGDAREGELADVRQRCRKRQHTEAETEINRKEEKWETNIYPLCRNANNLR